MKVQGNTVTTKFSPTLLLKYVLKVKFYDIVIR